MRRTEVLQGIRLMKFEEILERTRCRALSQAEAANTQAVGSESAAETLVQPPGIFVH